MHAEQLKTFTEDDFHVYVDLSLEIITKLKIQNRYEEAKGLHERLKQTIRQWVDQETDKR